MTDRKLTTLDQMHSGESGTIIQIGGGHGLANRLIALGIRPGKRVTKISSMFMRGPVTIRVDETQVAIGFGMANKLVVQPDGVPK